MSEKKEDLDKNFETRKSTKEEIKKGREISISSYYFDYLISIGVFNRLRERIRGLMEAKQNEIFYPEKSSPNFPLLMKNMVEKHFEGKRDLVILKKSGKNDIFFDVVSDFVDNFNFENFIEFQNRYALIYYFTELDNYLFRCFKFALTKTPDIIDKTKVSLKELREVNGDIKKIFQDKAEEKAMSKFDLNLLIDEIIEKKIHNKFYKDYTEVFHYAKKVLGIKHLIHKDLIDLLNFFKQIRNLYIHGDGTINQIFLKRIEPLMRKKDMYRIEEKFQLTDELIEDLLHIIRPVIIQFDKSIIKLYPELMYKSKE